MTRQINISGRATMPQTFRGRIELGDVTHHNIKQLKRVNQVVFPVSYNEKFYKDVVGAGELAKLAYFNDIVVGGVCCRVDNSEGRKKVYIMTLGCLAPYRRQSLGSLMLEHVFNLCKKDSSIDSICLHVQVSNEGALEFYKHFGFVVVETTKNYYKRIEPADAYYLEKCLKASPNTLLLPASTHSHSDENGVSSQGPTPSTTQ